MKAVLIDFHASNIDMMELCVLPPGELEISLRIRCDREAYAKFVEFLQAVGARRDGSTNVLDTTKLLPAGKV